MDWERDNEAEEMLRRVERKVDLMRALTVLSHQEREMILLRGALGFSVADAGRICGLPSVQARLVYDNALSTLRRLLQ